MLPVQSIAAMVTAAVQAVRSARGLYDDIESGSVSVSGVAVPALKSLHHSLELAREASTAAGVLRDFGEHVPGVDELEAMIAEIEALPDLADHHG
ncbi:hypothetical protein [Desulfohalovibrio reitneri]|uniref:hypothetical protein n=1 Tax=Desulfohalovibrio reitneri TaxID=1307759 RepID=UPI0004A77C77|nr:hypothetical protein [Desulfohalovibrio reitneri]